MDPAWPTGTYGEVTKILFFLDTFTSHFLSLSEELNPHYSNNPIQIIKIKVALLFMKKRIEI